VLLFLSASFGADDADGDDFYAKMGVAKDATIKDIRKAYKKMALTMHPDKSDDPLAHEKFSEVTRMYEVLKDDEMRKRYDKYGEKGLDENFNPNQRYESWSFFHEDFGLYDNDEDIEVLDRDDLYEAIASRETWFIKFYSERCSHCNELAPKFRELASQLAGVAKFGAISCRDYRNTCSHLGIRGYPTLLMFSETAGRFRDRTGHEMRHNEKYTMARDVDVMRDYVLKHKEINIAKNLSPNAFRQQKPTIFILSDSDGDSPIKPFPDQYILSNRLKRTFKLYNVNCDGERETFGLCKVRSSDEGGVLMQPLGVNGRDHPDKLINLSLNSFDPEELISLAYANIQLPELISNEQFMALIEKPTIVLLNIDSTQWSPHEWEVLKSLPDYIDENEEIQFRWLSWRPIDKQVVVVNCQRTATKEACDHFGSRKENKLIVFSGWGEFNFEVYHGEMNLADIGKFADDAHVSRVYQIMPRNYDSLLADSAEWFYDFSAPWCPPCRNFLPHIRYAAEKLNENNVKFGYVDCDAFKDLCRSKNVRSYPTMMFHGTDEKQDEVIVNYDGDHHWEDVEEWYHDLKQPSVIKLDAQSFYQRVVGRPDGEVWFVDFAANWCRPCQMMLSDFKHAAKQVAGINIHFGYVECTEYQAICDGFNIRSYPTIHLFQPKSPDNIDPPMKKYNYGRRDTQAFIQFLGENVQTPTPVYDGLKALDPDMVIRDKAPVVVDFYANWCRPCQRFMPIFTLANALIPEVTFMKIDCAANKKAQSICQKHKIGQYPTLKLFQRPHADSEPHQMQMREVDFAFDIGEFVDIVYRELKPHYTRKQPKPSEEEDEQEQHDEL